jgi:hypothetical protein
MFQTTNQLMFGSNPHAIQTSQVFLVRLSFSTLHETTRPKCWKYLSAFRPFPVDHQFPYGTYVISLLVGGFNPSEKYESQMGLFFPIYGKKHVPNHQPAYMYIPLELFLHFPKSWSSSLWKIAISWHIPFPDASTLGWKINDSFTSAIDLINTRLCCLMACRKKLQTTNKQQQ